MLAPKSPENEALDDMQRFLHAAVHDLRANQRRTGTAAELLLQASDGEERAILASQLLHSLAKTEELLMGIGRYAVTLTPASYTMHLFPSLSAVRFALVHLDREIRETNATVSFGDLPEIRGDRDRVVELLGHLIGNAIKFRGPNPPAVEIAANRVPEGWRFSVKDNGIGIAPKYRDRLFIPFRRLHGTDVPGAGLGLATCQRIVAAHRGRIWIEDGEGPGVTFSFTLPAGDGD
jgi:light-regulated signal transduction histidine kinase (bacteriophytochrome)